MTIKTPYPVSIKVYFDKIDFELEGICGLCEYDEDKGDIRIDISTNNGIEYLVHEISHCIDFIEEKIDQKIDTESKAYLMQYMFKRIYGVYLKKRQINK